MSLPSPSGRDPRGRSASARAMRSGARARISTILSVRGVALISQVLEVRGAPVAVGAHDVEQLGLGGHRGGALDALADDGVS